MRYDLIEVMHTQYRLAQPTQNDNLAFHVPARQGQTHFDGRNRDSG